MTPDTTQIMRASLEERLAAYLGRRHGLLSFDIGEFRKNLQSVLQECERMGRVFSRTVGECRVLWGSEWANRLAGTRQADVARQRRRGRKRNHG